MLCFANYTKNQSYFMVGYVHHSTMGTTRAFTSVRVAVLEPTRTSSSLALPNYTPPQPPPYFLFLNSVSPCPDSRTARFSLRFIRFQELSYGEMSGGEEVGKGKGWEGCKGSWQEALKRCCSTFIGWVNCRIKYINNVISRLFP